MNETKIKAWDEVHGVIEEEKTSTVSDIEAAGAGPSISKNYLRGVEDMVEQNDNNFDGVINNVPDTTPEGVKDSIDQYKKSVLEKLKEQPVSQEPFERKPCVLCPVLEVM